MGGVGRTAGNPRSEGTGSSGVVRDAVGAAQKIASSQKAGKIKAVKLKVKFDTKNK